jgi:uncharacterized protein
VSWRSAGSGVKVIDLNLLLSAVNRHSPHHERAQTWVARVLSGEEPVALPWVVLLGFLRLATSLRFFSRPLEAEHALTVIDGWLARATVVALAPGDASTGTDLGRFRGLRWVNPIAE